MTQKFTFDDIDIGYSFDGPAVSVTREMIKEFAMASFDNNPLHWDDAFMSETMFANGKKFDSIIGHGLMTYSFMVRAMTDWLWPENGDMLALQYAGTANLSKGSGIGDEAPKKSLVERSRGFVEKSVRSVNRYVHDRLLEDGRGAAVDSLLAGGMPRPEAAAAAVARRRSLSLLSQGSAGSVGFTYT